MQEEKWVVEGKKTTALILQQAEDLRISLSNVCTSSRSKSFFNAGKEPTFWGGKTAINARKDTQQTRQKSRAEREGKESTCFQRSAAAARQSGSPEK